MISTPYLTRPTQKGSVANKSAGKPHCYSAPPPSWYSHTEVVEQYYATRLPQKKQDRTLGGRFPELLKVLLSVKKSLDSTVSNR